MGYGLGQGALFQNLFFPELSLVINGLPARSCQNIRLDIGLEK